MLCSLSYPNHTLKVMDGLYPINHTSFASFVVPVFAAKSDLNFNSLFALVPVPSLKTSRSISVTM